MEAADAAVKNKTSECILDTEGISGGCGRAKWSRSVKSRSGHGFLGKYVVGVLIAVSELSRLRVGIAGLVVEEMEKVPHDSVPDFHCLHPAHPQCLCIPLSPCRHLHNLLSIRDP
jgi:hypothetical protein